MSQFLGRKIVIQTQDGYGLRYETKFKDFDVSAGARNGFVKINHELDSS